MAFRIIMPPLTSESMNLLKNSSVAFAVSIAELTMFAMQAQEETSRGIEIYLAVTALYVVSAFAVNRIMAFIEKQGADARLHRAPAAKREALTCMNLDFTFLNWDVISKFVAQGLLLQRSSSPSSPRSAASSSAPCWR